MEQEQVVHLTNSEYDAFTTQAKQAGQELEALIHEVLDDYLAKRIQLSSKANHTRSKREIAELLFEEGLTEHVSSGRTLSEEEKTERKKLADFFGQAGGMSASEMAIEDRGPY